MISMMRMASVLSAFTSFMLPASLFMIFTINLDFRPQILNEIQQGPDLFLGKPRKTPCNLANFLFTQFFIKLLSDIR